MQNGAKNSSGGPNALLRPAGGHYAPPQPVKRPMKALVAFLVALLSLGSLVGLAAQPVAAAIGAFDATDGTLDTHGSISSQTDLVKDTADNSYNEGAKENDVCPVVGDGGIPPSKDDFSNFYEGFSDGVLYLAFERSNANGTATIDFELNQSSVGCGNGVNKLRTIGDLLVTYDFQGGDLASVPITIRLWTGSEWGEPTLLTASQAEATISSDLLFGELAIDLTAAGIFTPGECVSFASAFPKSRSSNSFTSTLKDLVSPIDKTISNCGSLTVVKSTTGGTGTFTFNVDCGGVLSTIEIVNSGEATIDDIPIGTSCTVIELANGDFTSVVLPANGTVVIDEDGETVTFTNTRKTGDLVITKTTTGGTGTFTFTVDCTGTAFDQIVTITNTGSKTIAGIPTGTSCTVLETTDPEFTSTVSPTNGTVVIAVGANPVAFANTAKPAALAVVKTADAASVTSGATIGFTVTVTSTGTGTARAATLNDPLPASTGVSWSISPAYAGPGTCAITGAVPTQVLACSFGDLAPAATASVHISSATTAVTAGTLANTATAKATNAPEVIGSASIVVTPTPAVVQDIVLQAPPAPPAPVPAPAVLAAVELPRTGSDVGGLIQFSLALLGLGGMSMIPDHLRRRRRIDLVNTGERLAGY